MWLIRSNLMIILINTIFIFLIQFLFLSLVHAKLSVLTYQITFILFIFVPINIVIWYSKMNVGFYQHWLCIYVGFLCSSVLFYVIKAILVDKPSDFPPSEPYFDLFLTVFIYGLLQLLIFIFLNGVAYIIYKFTHKNQT
ncbi:hypothetical protein [Bacillus sp. B1-b2]|uniref:hypothetical protein n=1 Tax=Bacillus sp. B1-b2 TaxID=2653201 RepID=UPI0012621B95|nr:hypothetical protein [Bacillus sp. B1-b2]KAB7667109.1 hypothetical protein F9279_16050 [Bacillus sp. B1-b2]